MSQRSEGGKEPIFLQDLRSILSRPSPTAIVPSAQSPEALRAAIEQARYQNPPFRSGEERRSTNGSLETSLSVVYGDRKAWRPETVKGMPPVTEPAGVIDLRLRSYDGLPVGPTLRVKAGDVLRINLKNRLPVEEPADHSDVNKPTEFNRTNLHTHGLHVSPVGNSDNVLLEVRPGEELAVEVAIPPDHVPGTFWYHSHVHGSTAMQVSSGMAGALIVEPREGDRTSLDTVPGIAGAEERICLFQQISFHPQDSGQPGKKIYTLENYEGTFGNRRWTRGKTEDGWRTTINGQLQPVIKIKSGKMQRFRFIHGGIREKINVQIMPLPRELDVNDVNDDVYDVDALNDEGMREIALDGIPLDRIRKTKSVELQPGYRSDVLVRLSNDTGLTQKYILWDGLTDNDFSLDPDEPDFAKSPQVLAILEVEPAAAGTLEDPWPSEHDFAAVRRLAPIPAHEVVGLKEVQLQLNPALGVNGRPYDPAHRPMEVKLGRADEWKLTADLGSHPFHIHVNPFYVVSDTDAAGVVTPWGVWKDTLLIQSGRTYKVLTRYERYIGDFVLHCHILDHEDEGMMRGVRIVNSQYEVGTQIAAPYMVPLWKLPDAAAADVDLSALLQDMNTNYAVVVFLESLACPACNEQIQLYDRRKAEIPADVKVVFVAPGPAPAAPPAIPMGTTIAFDANLDQFKAYGCYLQTPASPLHGTFVLDKQGRVRWREISHKPYTDLDNLLDEIKLIKTP